MTDVRCDVCNVPVQQRNMNDHLRGKKHMKALQWRDRKEKAELCGIYVRGFPRDMTEDDVYGYFSRFGEITEFNFDVDGNFAIIEFRQRESANYCLTRPLYIGEFRLYVKNRHMREGPTRAEAVTPVRADILDHECISSLLASCNGNFEEQLSVLLREIQPPENNYHRIICGHLEYTFYQTFPGCKAYPFGSTVTGLSFKGSDLDVFLDINSGEENTEELSNSVINKGKKLLSRYNQYFRQIFGIPKAKTPIIKFVHVPTKTNCDLSFKNALGVNNSGLILFYLSMDPRLKPMLLIIKYWARRHDLSGTGKLSNYAIIMLALCYLQQIPQPVIPTVYDLQRTSERKTFISGWDCSYQGKVDSVGLGKNTMSIPELLHGFFKFYSTFDFETYLVCPLIGGILEKSAFQNPDSLPQELIQYKEKVSLPGSTIRFRADTCMSIQDPFELTHNLSAGMGAKAVDKFKLYCEAAAEICNEALKSEAHFLWNLFDESRKPRDVFWFGKSTLFKFPVIQQLGNNLEQTAEIYLKSLLEIFEKVLRVETEVIDHVPPKNVQKQKSEDSGQSVNKIQKLEGQVDVGRATQETSADQQEMQSSSEHKLEKVEGKLWKPKEIHCSGKVRVWEGRKVVSKSLEFPDGTDILMKEEIVSQYLEKEQLKRKQMSSINFVCLLKLKQDPTQAFLELHDKSCSKGDFGNFRTYLQQNLVRLVNKCVRNKQKTEVNMVS